MPIQIIISNIEIISSYMSAIGFLVPVFLGVVFMSIELIDTLKEGNYK